MESAGLGPNPTSFWPSQESVYVSEQRELSLARTCRKRNPHRCRWDRKLVQKLRTTAWKFLENLKTEPSRDPPTPLLGPYPEKIKSPCQRAVRTPRPLRHYPQS